MAGFDAMEDRTTLVSFHQSLDHTTHKCSHQFYPTLLTIFGARPDTSNCFLRVARGRHSTRHWVASPTCHYRLSIMKCESLQCRNSLASSPSNHHLDHLGPTCMHHRYFQHTRQMTWETEAFVVLWITAAIRVQRTMLGNRDLVNTLDNAPKMPHYAWFYAPVWYYYNAPDFGDTKRLVCRPQCTELDSWLWQLIQSLGLY